MPRPLRDSDPEAFRHISVRTDEARIWMLPTHNVAKILGGILARYQEIFAIEIYAYFFLGNHYHLLIRAPRGNTDEFMENVNREVARRLNWKNRRRGAFWGRPYDDERVLSEKDLLEAFLYITTNASKHGLIRDASKWPGLHSYNHSLDGDDRTFSFHHYSRNEGDPERITRHILKLSPLPVVKDMPTHERRAALAKLLRERLALIREERAHHGQGYLGSEGLKAQTLGAIPENVSRSPRPPCYTKCAELRREFRTAARERRARYKEASFRFRLGDYATRFPIHSYKPPLHRRPRLFPFTPLPSNHQLQAA